MKNLNIPVGISDFEKIRREGFYYIDKTGLVKELLNPKPAEVTLITRPRRFGKTLAMSMLENFFDIKKNSRDLFAGLEISASEELCSRWMNSVPYSISVLSAGRRAGFFQCLRHADHGDFQSVLTGTVTCWKARKFQNFRKRLLCRSPARKPQQERSRTA